ncbi:unnamed protein product [Natator depressus]
MGSASCPHAAAHGGDRRAAALQLAWGSAGVAHALAHGWGETGGAVGPGTGAPVGPAVKGIGLPEAYSADPGCSIQGNPWALPSLLRGQGREPTLLPGPSPQLQPQLWGPQGSAPCYRGALSPAVGGWSGPG